MLKHLATLSLSACLLPGGALTLAAQTPPPAAKLQFEVASVKPAPPPENPMLGSMMARALDTMPLSNLPMNGPSRVHIQAWPLKNIIAMAYGVRSDKVSGPSWLGDERFDIDAKLPEGAQKEQVREMTQSLLAERFGLEMHRDKRESNGFALVVGKHGPKLEEYVKPAEPATPLSPEEQKEKNRQDIEARMKEMRARMQNGPHHTGMSSSRWSNITSQDLAQHLVSQTGAPVVDETGLTGKYNVRIETWKASDDEPEETIFSAVEKLGLKLEPRKITSDILVIDKVSKTPTEN